MGATSAGTASYFQKHATGLQPLVFGRTNWSVSPFGFGSYRVSNEKPVHRESLTKAIESGCNLIDTSTNYTDGSSEALIGETLSQIFQKGQISREQIVIVSKIGYVQGKTLFQAQKKLKEKDPFLDMVEYTPECWHCIHPEFLREQLTQSLERLQVKQLDVLLLHNPEYFLKITPDRDEYHHRIQKAFAYLEQEVAEGRIQHYGISSNSFPLAVSNEDFTSLEKTLQIAKEIRDDHHYSVIQFPFNLFENGALREKNNGNSTLLEFAEKEKMATLINRPLNSFKNETVIRLADFEKGDRHSLKEEAKKSLEALLELEKKLSPQELHLQPPIAWGHIIEQNFDQIHDIIHWKDVVNYQISPVLEDAIETLVSHNPARADWVRNHSGQLASLIRLMTHFLGCSAAERSDKIKDFLDRESSGLRELKTLSQKALKLYVSVPGVHCVLVGMRDPKYVEDVLSIDTRDPSKYQQIFKYLDNLSL